MQKTKSFQIRWNEPLGKPECPYMYRWALIFFGFSIRLHHWIRSDDKRFFHDHPWDFLTIVLMGGYTDVCPCEIDTVGHCDKMETLIENVNGKNIPVHKERLSFGNVVYRKANHKHYVDVPINGAWTLLFTGRPKRKWGFWIEGKRLFRPLRYFSKYGHPPCSDQ